MCIQHRSLHSADPWNLIHMCQQASLQQSYCLAWYRCFCPSVPTSSVGVTLFFVWAPVFLLWGAGVFGAGLWDHAIWTVNLYGRLWHVEVDGPRWVAGTHVYTRGDKETHSRVEIRVTCTRTQTYACMTHSWMIYVHACPHLCHTMLTGQRQADNMNTAAGTMG